MTSKVETIVYPSIGAQVRNLSFAVVIILFPSCAIAQTADVSPPQLESKIPLGEVAGHIESHGI